MQYLISFLEGMITFISPCLLPMLPIYVSYFGGGAKKNLNKTLKCSIGFVAGFTAVFVAMGAMAGSFGSLIREYSAAVNVIAGLIVVFFGLNFLGIIRLNIFKGNYGSVDTSDLGLISSFVFGMIFSVGWTPCVGAFLGSALVLASQQGHIAEGMMMLLVYSLGLGVPFILSAVLIEHLKTAFDWIKKNYGIINKICGAFLIITGIFMATGTLGRFLSILS